MVSTSLFVGLAAAALANAQTIETSSASSVAATTTLAQAMPPVATASFNAAPVNETIRFSWCLAQLNTCPQICGGAAAQNYCDETMLTYTCVCPNGTSPDVTSFANTLPFFICQETFIQCTAANIGDAQAQQECTNNEQCGTRNATAEALSQTSAGSESTAAATSGAAESGSSATAASTSAAASETDNAAAINAHQLSTGAFAALLAVCFKFFL